MAGTQASRASYFSHRKGASPAAARVRPTETSARSRPGSSELDNTAIDLPQRDGHGQRGDVDDALRSGDLDRRLGHAVVGSPKPEPAPDLVLACDKVGFERCDV